MSTGKSDKTENLKPFQPGQSGNPSGRPKGSAGLPARIRAMTKDGQEVIDYFVQVFRGKHDLSEKYQHDAAVWLADRMWGKPVQAMEHSGPEGQALTIDIVDKLIKAARDSD